ncbi:MAG: DNA alkylation repair protein [bacterium]
MNSRITTAHDIRRILRKLGRKRQARVLQRYFKTGPGEYAEGDIFLGIRVPQLRKLASEYRDMRLKDVERLLQSPVHEDRLFALLVLVNRFARAGTSEQRNIFRLYFRNTQFVNNWDLVDLSAPQIVGGFLAARDKAPIACLAESASVWDRRISIMSTFQFIRKGQFSEALKIAGILIEDEEDLVHKAVGWMLREIGKRDMPVEEKFLKQNYRRMSRTTLRYAIEKFPENKRRKYLAGKI